MTIQAIDKTKQKQYNSVITHPLQSFEWGEFRKKTGVTVARVGLFEKEKLINGFTVTIHSIPKTPWTIGYLPKGNMPTKEILDELKEIGKQEKCIFVQLEPNIEAENDKLKAINGLVPSAHPLFTKYTFILDITKSEEELLKNMHPKTRYNIKVAQKHNVEIVEDNSDEAFNEYLRLTEETTKRQGFYAHSNDYHKKMWETLRSKAPQGKPNNELTAHLFLAKYTDDETSETHVLTAWIIFVFHKTLYYPYGASSSLYRNTMASNLMMWEVIKFGKRKGLEKFDMWGAIGPDPKPNDPWIGFHIFKKGYGPKLTEFIGSYDLILSPILYKAYLGADKLRWTLLRLRK